MVELFRQDTHGSLGGKNIENNLADTGLQGVAKGAIQTVDSFIAGANAASGTKVAQGGAIDHPEWWKIQVITFGKTRTTKLATMEDMICKSMNVIFFAPFYDAEPSMIEIDMAFQHGFRGVRQSMRFGA